ncbi:hypothetical protein [Amycolatopsis thermoflava]|uniref:hypothetical protein n=1 Tax=Amycolatopsis thermoflava TaxID=84480 RepID=UPI003EB8023E
MPSPVSGAPFGSTLTCGAFVGAFVVVFDGAGGRVDVPGRGFVVVVAGGPVIVKVASVLGGCGAQPAPVPAPVQPAAAPEVVAPLEPEALDVPRIGARRSSRSAGPGRAGTARRPCR